MAKYQILGTYVTGVHTGKTFVLERGGWVHHNRNEFQLDYRCYADINTAKRVCGKYRKTQNIDSSGDSIAYEVIEVR